MKDLKENIQKNNIKKLVLSVALGMFCYCTNNAMEIPQPKDINYVINIMIGGQIMILKEKLKMLDQSKKIYSTIKDEHGKVTKKNVLDFIQNQISTEEKTDEELINDIKTIEQYFHLEEIKNDNDECNEGNLTEIFWNNEAEGEEGEKKIENVVDKIKSYFITIILIEETISKVFKDYYDAKKTVKGEVENVEDVVIEEIMQECCGKETEGEKPTKFFANLENLCPKTLFKETKETILATIKRRITLTEPIKEEDIKSFLKQKIGIEEKKEEEKENKEQKNEPKKEKEGCPCCNCQKNRLKKKENPKGDLGRKSKEKKLEGEGGAQESDKSIK